VHADVVGHIPQDQWFELLDAVVQKRPLELDDGYRDLVDRALALFETLDQTERGAQLVQPSSLRITW
jgi:hypothetical protein